MEQKKKRVMILGAVALGLVLAVLVLTQTMAVNVKGAFTEAGGCISVAFDKATVMNADKVVVRIGDTTRIITDPDLVQEIAAGFVVANRTDLCGSYDDYWLEIYNGDKLVRKIHRNACCNLAEIYEVDAAHWVWPSTTRVGQVELSEEFQERLNQIVWSGQN